MLKAILSISGKPGLYKLVSQGKNMLIVESLQTKKRVPAYSHDKVVSLGDIAVYTTGEEVQLTKVFETIYKKFEGKTVNASDYKTQDALKNFFLEILPDFDQERVYITDIKKIISWYNTLVESGNTDFVEEESEKAEEAAAEEK